MVAPLLHYNYSVWELPGLATIRQPPEITTMILSMRLVSTTLLSTLHQMKMKHICNGMDTSMFIVVLPLQHISKLPPLWNVKYPFLFYKLFEPRSNSHPCLSSPLIIVMSLSGHMTIAAIFEHGNKLLSV